MPAGTRIGLLAAITTAILLATPRFASAAVVNSSVRAVFFEVTTFETEQVTLPPAANANFVKYVTIDPVGTTEAMAKLEVEFPGRAFINYVDSYLDAGGFASSSTLAQIKVSGDVFDLVYQLDIFSLGYDETTIFIGYDSEFRDEGYVAGHLLVEISVFRANAVRSIFVNGSPSLEIVINDGVVNSLNERDLFPENSTRYFNNTTSSFDTEAEQNDSLDIFANKGTKLFLQSSSTPLNIFSLSLSVAEGSSMFVNTGYLVVSNSISTSSSDAGIIVARFESVQAYFLGLYTFDSSSICVVATSWLETDETFISDPDQVTLPGLTGGKKLSGATTCSLEPIPSRLPRDTRLFPNGSSVPASSEGSTSTESSSTGGSTPPPQDNAVAMVEYAHLLMLLTAFVAFELSAS